jgi:hypothetical protein
LSLKSSIQNVHAKRAGTNESTIGIEIVGVRSSLGSKESTHSPSFRRLVAIEEPIDRTCERSSIGAENIKTMKELVNVKPRVLETDISTKFNKKDYRR